MSKIYMKDIRNICSCISGLSCQTVRSKKFMFEQLLRYYKKWLNNWIELYNSDSFKTKKEKKRLNYYINKLKEFESMAQE